MTDPTTPPRLTATSVREVIVEALEDVPLHEHRIRENGVRVLWLGMTYAEAVAAVDLALAATLTAAEADAAALRAALEELGQLHGCSDCGHGWPCGTRRVITAALATPGVGAEGVE